MLLVKLGSNGCGSLPACYLKVIQLQKSIGSRLEGRAEIEPFADRQVRPYLIADGGDVSVAAVEGGTVMLRLEGACGTCPSSTATMKMGIERALKVRAGVLLRCHVAELGLAPMADSVCTFHAR